MFNEGSGMRWHWAMRVVVGAGLFAGSLRAAELEEIVKALGGERFEGREAAQKELEGLGVEKVEEVLKAAAEAGDPVVRGRLERK